MIPIYKYKCKVCGNVFTNASSITDKTLRCPKCNSDNTLLSVYDELFTDEQIEFIKNKINNIEIQFIKTHPDAILPSYNNSYEDAGFDLYTVEDITIFPGENKIINVGLELAYITPGYWVQFATRSSMGFKKDLNVYRGVVDNGYRYDLNPKIYNLGNTLYSIKKGDKVCQLIVYPLINAKLSFIDKKIFNKNRNEKGFGSSGK